MNAKEYLQQAQRLDTRIRFDLKELEHWRELSGRISGGGLEPRYGYAPRQSIDPPFVKCLDKVIDLEQKIKGEISALVDMKSEILEKIHTLDNVDQQSVLEFRYLSCMTWEQIAEEMRYSPRWIYKLHGMALKELDKRLGEAK